MEHYFYSFVNLKVNGRLKIADNNKEMYKGSGRCSACDNECRIEHPITL